MVIRNHVQEGSSVRPHALALFLSFALLVAGCGTAQSRPSPPAGDLAGKSVRAPAPAQFRDGPEATSRKASVRQSIDYASRYPGIFLLRGPSHAKVVALSFDDGPDNLYTPRILDVLRRERVHATFFVVGTRVEQYPQVVRRMVREGHAVGSHTWDHANLTKLPPEQIRSEMIRTDRAVQRVAGVHPALARPPYGAVNDQVIQTLYRMGYRIVDWSVDSLDWKELTADQVAGNVLSHVSPGAIILQHAAGGKGEDLSGTVNALPRIIRTLRSEGYRFATIPELLHIPATLPGEPR
ncbi:MAG: polysaccharide deacetylase family protein [Alicyclobacillaceae bacterium]|nr:polysaccharide deacetylase family protein [Alicyclobacillaceae bacterium]